MTDAAAAAAPADTSTTPAISDLLQPQVMTVEQAQAKRVEYLGKPGFAERVLANDPESVRAWKEIQVALNPKLDQSIQQNRDYTQRMNGLSILKAKADLPDAAWQWVASAGPVSLAERQKALQLKAQCMADRSFVEKYLSGERSATSTLTNINLILAAKVGTFDEIEQHKAALAKLLGTSK